MELPRLIKVELTKIFLKRSTWVGFLIIAFFPIIISLYNLLLSGDDSSGRGIGIIEDSLWLGKMFAVLFVIVVSVGTITGEAKDRTLRTSLTKPVSRENVLLSKFIGVTIYIIAILLFLIIIGALPGIRIGFVQPEASLRDEVVRLALYLLVCLCELMFVASFCFLVAVLTTSTMIAFIVGLAFNNYFWDLIQTAIIEPLWQMLLEKYSITALPKNFTIAYFAGQARQAIFGTYFSTEIDWRLLQTSLGVMGVYILAFLLIATFVFERKDIKG